MDDPRQEGMEIRAAGGEDLPALNCVIEAAVMAWPLTERVKRLSLPLLRYGPLDLADYSMLLFESGGQIVGVAAWCETVEETRTRVSYAHLHGLYVHPSMQRRGIGEMLVGRVLDEVRSRALRGVLVKAERVSARYFEHLGLARLPEDDGPGAAYPYRYWIPAAARMTTCGMNFETRD